MTLTTLKRDMAEWQTRLNIPEWKIKLRWGGKRAMKNNVGLCYWMAEELTAEILLAKDQKNPRSTLIHELLHIVLDGHKEYGAYDELHERSINRIVDALMRRD